MPGSVRTAAILWIVLGGVGALGQTLQLVLGGFRASSVMVLLISLAIIAAGLQTAAGRARDTLGNGIGSLVLGLLGLVLFALATAVLGLQLATVVGLSVAAGLIVTGIMALAGRSRYRKWLGRESR